VGPWPSSLVVASDQVITAQYEEVVLAWLERPLRMENGLVEPSLEAHLPKGLYIARTLVQDCRELLVHERIPLAHCEPVT
jgi:hypothetical protein